VGKLEIKLQREPEANCRRKEVNFLFREKKVEYLSPEP